MSRGKDRRKARARTRRQAHRLRELLIVRSAEDEAARAERTAQLASDWLERWFRDRARDRKAGSGGMP